MFIKDTLVSNIRDLRKQKGLTQAQFAELIGVSHSFIRQVETGQSNFSLETISKIAEALELPVYVLFETEEDKSKINSWRVGAFDNYIRKSGFLDQEKEILPIPTSNISKLKTAINAVPDEIYDLAQKISPDNEIWKEIELILEVAIEEIEENGNGNHNKKNA